MNDRQYELDKRDERLRAERRFSPPPGHCPYCGSAMYSVMSGWYYLDTGKDCLPQYEGADWWDTPRDGDIFVMFGDERPNAWFRSCGHCNPQAILPEGITFTPYMEEPDEM